MDKSWIKMPRNTPEYKAGLIGFLKFAFRHSSSAGRILCPCSKCGFTKRKTPAKVYDHLLLTPFPQGYTFWCRHGETLLGEPVVCPSVIQENPVNEDYASRTINEDLMQDMINDAFGFSRMCANEVPFPSSTEHREGSEGGMPESHHGATGGAKEFYDLLKDGGQPLYDGCTKYSKLSFLVKLYHIKCLCQVSDKAMSMIIELLQDAFEHAKIPASSYEAKKVINKLGLTYTKIHSCPNDCMLYWGENEDLEECKVCKISRWRKRGKEKSSVQGRVRGVGDGVSPSQLFGSPYQRFSTSSSSFNSVEHNRVTQLENQVQKLTNESEAKDEKMKRIEKLLAQLLANSSMHVPSDLDTSLDNIQTPGGPSSRSDTNHP